jgi:streptogramin lyase
MKNRKSPVPLVLLVGILLTACAPAVQAASRAAVSVPASAIPPSSPTAMPQPTVTPTPPTLEGRYFYAGAILGPFLDILPDGSDYYSPDQNSTLRDTYVVAGNQLTFSGQSCNGAKGVYDWSMQQEILTLSVVTDTCFARSNVLAQVLKKVPQQLAYVNVLWNKPLVQPDFNQSTVDAAGNFYITDGGSGTYKYNPDGTLAKSWNSLSYTVGVTVDGQGNMYVSNFDDASIHKFDTNGKPVLTWNVDGGNIGPVGLAHDSQGNIYVALHRIHDHYIEKYTPDGKLLASWAGGPGAGDGQVGAGSRTGPEEVAVDAAGNSYITDPVNNRLVKFDANGKFLYNLTGDGTRNLRGPGIVAVDSHGNVYTDSDQEIWEFDNTGKFIGEWFTPDYGNLVIDSKDNIYSIDQGIMKIELPAP